MTDAIELSDAQEEYLGRFTEDYARAMLWANTREMAVPDSECQADGPGQEESHDLGICSHNGSQATDAPVFPEDWQTPADGWALRAFAVASQRSIQDDCRDFVAGNWSDLEGIDAGEAGHDFALTRNGHGAGFWDRGLGDAGDRLTNASKPYGASGAWFERDDAQTVHLDDEPAPDAPEPFAAQLSRTIGEPYAGYDETGNVPSGQCETPASDYYRDLEAGS
jgi:hypothetical protein